MENIMLLILGVVISVMGIVNIKGNISTIHSYNRRRVKEEDIPKYGKAVGTGTLIIGISLVLGFIVSFWSEIIIDYIILPAVIVGLGFILYGQFSVIAEESDFIQSELYKNSNFLYPRNNRILYYDCTNYYFEIEEESDSKRYGKSKGKPSESNCNYGIIYGC